MWKQRVGEPGSYKKKKGHSLFCRGENRRGIGFMEERVLEKKGGKGDFYDIRRRRDKGDHR